jgi:lipooligosaccharide transport system permease protein
MIDVAQSIRATPVWGGFRVWQRNRDAFVRAWKVEIGGIAVEPLVMLVAVGFGLGAFVEDIGDLSYAEFLAPGLIASQAVFHATFDSTYGAYLRMETHHLYEAILFTPLGPADIVVGEVMWGATRALVAGAAVLAMAAAFGLVGSPLALLAIPIAYLIGLMIGSIAMIMTATATTIGAMNNFFTLFVLPMFWVSGVFFPLDRLPDALQAAAWALPLTPAAALVRGLVTGDMSWWMLLWLLEMIAFTLVALRLASFFMHRRLIR